MTELSISQRATLLQGIQYRATRFPRTTLIDKLTAADSMYHMANSKVDLAESDPNNQEDTYSRFQELDEAIVREAAEAYHSYYATTYLSTARIFSMTSAAAKREQSQKFNVVLMDQQQRMNWAANLSKFLLDCAKYNLAAVDVYWKSQTSYNIAMTNATALTDTLSTASSTWRGNAIERIDMYNCIFDHTVTPTAVAEEGEYAGVIYHMTQTRLNALVAQLKLDDKVTVYDVAPENTHNWSIYSLSDDASSNGLQYHEVTLEPLGGKNQNLNQSDNTNWAAAFGLSSNAEMCNRQYQLAKVYIRVVPSVYNFPKSKGDVQEVWEVWILGGSYILATKRLDCAHGYLPILFGQPDEDSLKYNSAGPAQIAIPYQKTAKQLLDRLLAGADRAIRDRAIYDSRYIDSDALNSSIPDAKIPVKENLPSTKSLSDVYYSIPYHGDTTRLGADLERVKLSAQRAAGINNSQVGQFTKGNKTLEEYSDVQANAQGKQYLRALMLESTVIVRLKRILKLNILQYQEDTSLYDSDSKTTVDITREELYRADVDFKLADGLVPTEHMLSPNVIQQVLSLIGTNPQAFANYNIADMTVHIIQQSLGVDLTQFDMTGQQVAPPPAAPPTGA